MKGKASSLGAILLLSLIVAHVSNSQTSTAPSGSGTSGDPYQVDSLANLYWITQNSTSWNKHFIQTADIDASSDTSWDSNQGFSPIGTSGTMFTGVYNGQGHTVTGVFISRGSANYIGMFGYADYPDTIENLGLINVNIAGATYTGGLVAFNYSGSTTINCYTSGNISATYSDYIGGLVGYNNSSTVSNCYSSVIVTVNSASSYVGGLAGYSRGQSTINNCYATGSVNGGGSYAGGLVGYNNTNGASPVALISNSYSLGKVTGSSPAGAFVGQNDAAVDSCFWNKDTSGTTGIGGGTTNGAAGKTTVQMKDPSTFTAAGWDTASWYMGDGVNNGYPFLNWQYPSGTYLVTAVAPSTSNGTYLIASLDNLYWITQNSSSWGSSFKQTADIDASQTSGWASGSGFSPIGYSGTYFSGTYDGNGHTISNLFISRGSTSAVGLFGFPKSGATIKNLGVVNVNIKGSGYVGALVGDNDGTVSNCYSTGSVNGSSLVGGLIGGIVSGSASNSYSTASVSGGSSVGGLVGYLLSASVSDCYSTGSVSGGSSTGGLIGSNSGSVSNSFWDTQTSGQSGGSGTGETTANMKTQSTFTNAGWDFTNTWAIDTSVNSGYPALIWQSQFSPAPPVAVTDSGTSVYYSGATLNGTVTPYKGTPTVEFVYGPVSGTYPDTVTASQSPLGGWAASAVSAHISGLNQNQTYYFRVIASSSYGFSEGSELSFTTKSFPTISTVPGTALSFVNQSNKQYISVPDNPSLELTDSLTFEAWVYPTASGNMTILDKGNYNYLFEIRPNGQTGLGIYNVSWGWVYSAGTVPLNTWSHVAVVFQTGSNGVKFYLNGSLLSQSTAPGKLTTNAGTFAIGEQQPSSCQCNFFQGMLDEVSVWGVPRTEAQIQTDMNKTLTGTESGLIAYWQFNEGTGTVAADSVGGNNGTLTSASGGSGTPTWIISEAPVGKYGARDTATASDSAGLSGSSVTTTIVSPTDSLDFLGLYSYGSPTDTAITTETFPSGIDKRWPVVWGIFEAGSDTANVTLNYSSLGGIQNESTIHVMQREAADSPWVDVTSNFSQNIANHTFTRDSVSTFSQFAIGAGSDNVLPVEMASFTATASRLTANLQWKTATEVNTNGWEIQRSEVGPASSNPQSTIGNPQWIDVVFVKGAGTSTSPKNYAFVDHGLSAGTYSYRLKQIDNNGSVRFSKTVNVDVGNAPRVFTLSQNYPNPFNPTTTIEFTLEKDGRVSLKVYDILGREVATLLDENRKAGEYQQVVFDGSRYSSGVYFAVLQSGGRQLIKKMLMIK